MKNKFFGGLLLVILCGFYTIPLIAVALLANLAALYVLHSFFLLVSIAIWRSQSWLGARNDYADLPMSDSSIPGSTITRGCSPLSSVRFDCSVPSPDSYFWLISIRTSSLGIVPPILTLVLQMVLPMIIRSVSLLLFSSFKLSNPYPSVSRFHIDGSLRFKVLRLIRNQIES